MRVEALFMFQLRRFDCFVPHFFSSFSICVIYDLTEYLVELHKEMILLDRLSLFDKPQE